MTTFAQVLPFLVLVPAIVMLRVAEVRLDARLAGKRRR